jgi:hypothetical protein
MESTPSRRVLVVANRTAAAPDLLDAVTRYRHERATTFALLIPDAPSSPDTDWTLEQALPLLERAAGGPVEGLTGSGGDPFDAVRNVLEDGSYDRVIISTLPKRVSKWLRRDLPGRVKALGIPVEVITEGQTKRSHSPTDCLLDTAGRSVRRSGARPARGPLQAPVPRPATRSSARDVPRSMSPRARASAARAVTAGGESQCTVAAGHCGLVLPCLTASTAADAEHRPGALAEADVVLGRVAATLAPRQGPVAEGGISRPTGARDHRWQWLGEAGERHGGDGEDP